MDEQWLGKGVDLNCGVLGVFQGVIDAVNLGEQTITIKNVIHDVSPFEFSMFSRKNINSEYMKKNILIYTFYRVSQVKWLL